MADKLAIQAEALRLREGFQARGAEVVETDILQSAETLLDLYGEDIRGRAYVTSDPVRGEAMLRPDFTVPVVEMHMAGARSEARYTYAGEVFRKQEVLSNRASEYVQVGFEVFGGDDPARAEAEVFVAFRDVLAPFGLMAATGDIGLLTAAVDSLSTNDRRKRALMRHIWRPQRFRALMKRFGSPGVARTFPPSGAPEIGLRTRAEVEERQAALRAEAVEPPISEADLALLDELLGLNDTAVNALDRLRALAREASGLSLAVQRFEKRLEALSGAGVDVDQLPFEASYGRTSMEYYDGFVFGFSASGRGTWPPVATGGRYDALTRAMGGGRAQPAVGGIVRPALVLALREGA